MPYIMVENPISIRVRQLRLEKGMTQSDLARLCHKAQSTICDIERGAFPTGETLQGLAAALETTESYLAGVTNER